MFIINDDNTATVFLKDLGVDKSVLKDIRTEALELLDKQGLTTIYLDLEGSGLIDSLCLGFLVFFHNKCKETSFKYFIKNLDSEQSDLFKSTGLDRFLSFKLSDDTIDLSDATIDLGLSLDYENINENIGVISFSGIMNTIGDSRLFCGIATKVIEENGKVLLDMSDMTFIDSLGIGEIIKLYKLAGSDNQRLKISNAGVIMSDLLESSGLDKILGIYDSRQDALADWT